MSGAVGNPLLGQKFLALVLIAALPLSACDFTSAPPPYSKGAILQGGVHYVSSRRWKERGLEWLNPEGRDIALVTEPPNGIGGDVTIFVHGFNSPETRVASYFKDLISHLQKPPGYEAQPVVYDWPSRTRHWTGLSPWERFAYQQQGIRNPTLSWEISQYGADAVWAREEGAPGLIALLEMLAGEKGKRKTDIIAHSMGCLVVVEAMRRNRKAFRDVRLVFWLAPDLPYDVLEDEKVQRGIAKIETLHVMYSNNDAILKRLSAALHLSGMLGSSGPADRDDVPANVVVHDFTEVLGTEDVHSRYKAAGSAPANLMADTLADQR